MGVSAADMSDSGVSSSRPRMWAGRRASWSSSAVCYRFLKTFSKCQSCHGESARVQTHELEPLGAVADLRVRSWFWDEQLSSRRKEKRNGGAAPPVDVLRTPSPPCLTSVIWPGPARLQITAPPCQSPVRVRLALFYSLLITPTRN